MATVCAQHRFVLASTFLIRIESCRVCAHTDKQHVGFGDAGSADCRGARADGGHASRSAAVARGWETRRKRKARGSSGEDDKKTSKGKSAERETTEADDEETASDDQQ